MDFLSDLPAYFSVRVLSSVAEDSARVDLPAFLDLRSAFADFSDSALSASASASIACLTDFSTIAARTGSEIFLGAASGLASITLTASSSSKI